MPVGVEHVVDLPRQVDLLHVRRHLRGQPPVARGPGRSRSDDRRQVLHHRVEVADVWPVLVVVEEAVHDVEPSLDHPPQIGDHGLGFLALGPHGPHLVERPRLQPVEIVGAESRSSSWSSEVTPGSYRAPCPARWWWRPHCPRSDPRAGRRRRDFTGHRAPCRARTRSQRDGAGAARAGSSGRRPGRRWPGGRPARSPGCRCSAGGCPPRPRPRRPATATTRFTSSRPPGGDRPRPRCRPPAGADRARPRAGRRRPGSAPCSVPSTTTRRGR